MSTPSSPFKTVSEVADYLRISQRQGEAVTAADVSKASVTVRFGRRRCAAQQLPFFRVSAVTIASQRRPRHR